MQPSHSFGSFRALAAQHGCTVTATRAGTWHVRSRFLVVELDPAAWAPLFRVRGSSVVYVGRAHTDAIHPAVNAPPRLASNRERHSLRRFVVGAERCYWCHLALDPGEATADHRIPRARGGCNSRANVVPACERCNRYRADRMPELLAGGAA